MSCSRRSKSLVSIARTKVSTTATIVAASPGVIAPSANAEVTAFIAAAISAAPSIGGSAKIDGAFAAGRQNSFDAEPHRGRIAARREFDSPARQSLGLAREQRGGGRGRLVARAGPAAR